MKDYILIFILLIMVVSGCKTSTEKRVERLAKEKEALKTKCLVAFVQRGNHYSALVYAHKTGIVRPTV